MTKKNEQTFETPRTSPHAALGTVPDGGNEYVAHGTAQTWDGRREGAEDPMGGANYGDGKSPNAEDGAKAAGVNDAAQAAGKKLHDETPTISTPELLAHTNPRSPLAAKAERSVPVVTAPTVTPKGKLGYLATPCVPVGGVIPGVAQGGAPKADMFVESVVETSVTKR